jgi:hypothetical protein
MTTPFEIPLSPTPQTFAIELDGVSYRMIVKWCPVNGFWLFDLALADDTPILQGIPITTSGDLLGQFGYLGIGGQLIAQTDHDPTAPPTFDNLGVTSHLYFIV